MRILITGATGFVGGYLGTGILRRISAPSETRVWGAGHQPPPGAPDSILPPSVQVLYGDLTHRPFLEEVIAESQPDQVYHLAGFASGAGTDRERIFHVNVEATVALLDLLAGMGKPCRVLLASSGYVYGATEPGRPAREPDPIAAHGAYAESKAAMEQVARERFTGSGSPLKIVVTRAFNHTVPHQTTVFAIPAFASQIARIERYGSEPTVHVGNLDASRDYLDVRDVVRAYRLLLSVEQDAPYQVVNVASGKSLRMRGLLDRLISLARVPVTVNLDPDRLRPSDIPDCAGDRSLLTSLTGWQPEIPIEQTLADTLDWWRGLPDHSLGRPG